jgi:hypothetical protein
VSKVLEALTQICFAGMALALLVAGLCFIPALIWPAMFTVGVFAIAAGGTCLVLVIFCGSALATVDPGRGAELRRELFGDV